MAHQEDNADGLVIKIPTSLFEKHKDRNKEDEKVTRAYDLFRRTNIISIPVKRNSEHGTTEVQSLDFREDGQRIKVLELLSTHSLYKKLPSLLEYIYQLGCEIDVEKRCYAAIAISELAIKQPFLDLKNAVILPWAKNDNPQIRNSAAIALSQLLKQESHKPQVLKLLKHWISLGHQSLTDSALSTYYWSANSQPNETLEAIGIIIKNNETIDYPIVIDIFRSIYDNSPSLVIDQLYNWLIPVADSNLCWIAGMLCLGWIQLDDATEDENTREKVSEMMFTLWENPNMPLHKTIQERTTCLIEIWANEVVDKMNRKESASNLKPYKDFFEVLYQKYEGKRNRLDFYLKQWDINRERAREREQIRASRRGGENVIMHKEKFSFRHLLPLA